MNGSVGSSRPKRQKQELAGSNGAVPASETESGDPVVGLAVRIVEIIATYTHAPVSFDARTIACIADILPLLKPQIWDIDKTHRIALEATFRKTEYKEPTNLPNEGFGFSTQFGWFF